MNPQLLKERMKSPLTIAIDGPSASGKGTLAKKIAQHFNLACLNTGALYRLVALRVLQREIAVKDFDHHIENLVANITENELEQEELFSEKTGAIASVIAKNPKLRSALFGFQKTFVQEAKLKNGGVVIEGRDTTTVICPDADYKFFVTADVEIRAQRRFNQLKTDPSIIYEDILAQLKTRDDNDFNRKDSPLKIAEDATIIDNGTLSVQEGVEKVLEIIK